MLFFLHVSISQKHGEVANDQVGGKQLYDGVVHLINTKHVHSEDVASMEVGKMARVKRGGRTWRGEVVIMPQHLPDDPVPPESHTTTPILKSN